MIFYEMAEGDTDPLVYEVEDKSTGGLYDLTGSTVTFSMWRQTSHTVVFEGQACTHDDTGGQITYAWATADTDSPGDFFGQFKITLSNSKVKHEPADYKNLFIRIHSRVESEDTVVS